MGRDSYTDDPLYRGDRAACTLLNGRQAVVRTDRDLPTFWVRGTLSYLGDGRPVCVAGMDETGMPTGVAEFSIRDIVAIDADTHTITIRRLGGD